MSNNFFGSIAQKNVQFPIETVVEPLAGENYTKVLIFAPLSQAADYLPGVDSPAAKTITELTSSNYSAITGGLLKKWLVPFFTKAVNAKVGIALFDDGESAEITLSVVYEEFKMYGYFKLAIAASTALVALNVNLSTLCLADPLYSDCWIGTSDSNVLTKTSTLISQLTAASSNAHVIYNPNADINPALAQLGATLAQANSSGVAVGNSIDMLAFNTIEASGSTDESGEVQNLTATEVAALDAQKIAYNTYIGDRTSNVCTEGSLTLQGESVGANWLKNYITYMCKIKTANMMTKMNVFRNNETYQAILLILSDQVQKFVDMGRLADFVITAPAFADLPSSGDTITVANAWSATYVDNTREVTVYGTLYITQPTR